MLYEPVSKRRMEYKVYSLAQPQVVNANSTGNFTITVANFDFWVRQLSGGYSGGMVIGNMLIQLKDVQSSADWFDRDVAFETVVNTVTGVSELTGFFGSKIIKSGGNITIRLTNTTGGNLNVFLTVAGFELR